MSVLAGAAAAAVASVLVVASAGGAGAAAVATTATGPPNILIIVADDYGWNDGKSFGFHGSELETPAIDQLAAEGVRLDNYYVLPVCTPTRSALLSGRFPIRTGLQVSTISPAKPYGLHLNYSTLADELGARGYRTAALGKWHCGFCREEFAPHRRGFDTFTGYLNGAEHYFSHIRDPDRVSFRNFSSGFDFYNASSASPPANATGGARPLLWAQNRTGPTDNVDPALGNCYSAHELAAAATAVVEAHPLDPAVPLFMYLAFQSVHSPLEAPQSYVDQYGWMRAANYTPVNANRQLYGGMVAALDEAVANVTAAFRRKGGSADFFDNTLLVFTSDNGAIGAGNNFPLRGQKATLWEGGTRAVGFVRGHGLDEAVANTSSNAMVHAVDWLPTLLGVADRAGAVRAPAAHGRREGPGTLDGIDGVDVWAAVSSANGSVPSPRTEFVYNIEPKGKGTEGMLCGAVRVGCHKLVVGQPGEGEYDPQPQPRPSPSTVPARPLAFAHPGAPSAHPGGDAPPAATTGSWLFDLCDDPYETKNLFNESAVASIQAVLEQRLQHYRNQMVPALYNVVSDDYRMDPTLNNGTWTWFGCLAE